MLEIKFLVQVLQNQKQQLDSPFSVDFQQPHKEKSIIFCMAGASVIHNAKQPQDMFHLVLPA